MRRRIALAGGNSEVGAAIARKLANGCSVLGLDEAASSHLGWHRIDLADVSAVTNLRVGTLDGLINAAERLPCVADSVEILKYNWLCTRALTETLLPDLSPGAAIVTVASEVGRAWRENLDQVRRLMVLPQPDDLPAFVLDEKIDPDRAYALSKEALIAWTKQITKPLMARGLRANTISPAASGSLEAADCTGFDAVGSRESRRAAGLDKVAAVAAFLVDPDSSLISGQDLVVDGGLSAVRDANVKTSWD